jgi:hypothetical protein
MKITCYLTQSIGLEIAKFFSPEVVLYLRTKCFQVSRMEMMLTRVCDSYEVINEMLWLEA